MAKTFRALSKLFFISALTGIVALVFSDVINKFRFTAFHQKAGALPLIFIGLSYFCFQLSTNKKLKEKTKGILLGIAFIFWGSEQYLKNSPLVTIMDSMVIIIFVVDLSLIIAEHLKSNDDKPL